jgi:hypothetical protein
MTKQRAETTGTEMTKRDPLNFLIYLDPWLDNPISEAQVREQIGGDVIVHALHEHGIKPTRIRNDGIAWDEWIDGVESLIRACERDGERHADRDLHYFVCGRAPLPLFAYVGIRLSKWASRVSVINRREDIWDRIVIAAGNSGGDPFFMAAQRLEGIEEVGKVAVFISTEHEMDLATVRAYMRKIKEPIVGVVELRTDGRRWLTEANAGAAAAEIDAELQGLRRHFPRHTGVVVFVAGPTHLALMVGRASNPRIHGSVEFPNFAGPDYVPALRYPLKEVIPRILILTANPSDCRSIQDGHEIHGIKEMLRMSLAANIAEPLVETSVSPENFLWAMNRHKPHILHISAHGSTAGDIGLVNEDGKLSTAPMEGMKRALLATGKSVRLVILNACYSAVLARELAGHFDYVIGVEDPLLTPTAIAFAKGFYGALGEGKNLAEALEQGRTLAAMKNLRGPDHILGFPRPGFDPSSWIPFPARDSGS